MHPLAKRRHSEPAGELLWGTMMRRSVMAAAGLWLAATAAAYGQTAVERGRYLVETIAACGNCHTPKGPQGDLPNMALAGGFVIEEQPFTAIAPNITPDPDTGIGKWTDAQLFLAIREGRRPDGSLIGPPMPFEVYRGLADDDVRAMIAFLRTVKPIRNAVARSTYRMPLPPAWGPPVGDVKAPPRSDRVAYGAYLAGPLGHCTDCHTPHKPDHSLDMSRVGAGGRPFTGPWGTSVSANITPHGIADWNDAEIERAIRTGVSKDGRKLFPPMAYGYYARIDKDDMAALIAYLRSLPPSRAN
jgi:mono/diheme cytochrome c family protein